MRTLNSGQSLSIAVLLVGMFHTISALSFPVPDRQPHPVVIGLGLALLLAHAALYWFGPRLRARLGLRAYVASQTALIFTVGLTGALIPVGLALLFAFTAQTIVLAREEWGSVAFTVGAILVYVVAAFLVQDLYRAATAGLLLALTGVITHGTAALLHRGRAQGAQPMSPGPAPVPAASIGMLTTREAEILRALATGSRNGEIASGLGITERTVKAHLASIYQKLGVSTRAAAVATAHQRGLVGRLP